MLCTCEGRSIGSPPGAEFTGGCELPLVDPGNQILVVWLYMLLTAEPSFQALPVEVLIYTFRGHKYIFSCFPPETV